jgi:hypothetical protein
MRCRKPDYNGQDVRSVLVICLADSVTKHGLDSLQKTPDVDFYLWLGWFVLHDFGNSKMAK